MKNERRLHIHMSAKMGVLIETVLANEVIDSQDQKCFGCNCRLSLEKTRFQHRVAKSLGGTNDKSNLLAMCQSCHGYVNKSIRLPIYLIKQIERWMATPGANAENKPYNLSTLLRNAVTQLMINDFVNVDEHRELRLHVNNLEVKVDKINKDLATKEKLLLRFREEIDNEMGKKKKKSMLYQPSLRKKKERNYQKLGRN
tara:strand:- start:4832 stop:5428 length:597 start_codon:yes stop_codon:yes gene_type:complete